MKKVVLCLAAVAMMGTFASPAVAAVPKPGGPQGPMKWVDPSTARVKVADPVRAKVTPDTVRAKVTPSGVRAK